MTNKKEFDPTKPVRTRDGRAARILCTDFKNDDGPIIAAITFALDGKERVFSYHSNGRYYTYASNSDLVNIPEKHVRWVNVFHCGGYLCATKEIADSLDVEKSRIACVRIEFEEGEGL